MSKLIRIMAETSLFIAEFWLWIYRNLDEYEMHLEEDRNRETESTMLLDMLK